MYPEFAHSAIISGETMSGKTEFILNLLENEYKDFFTYIVVICPNWSNNRAYLNRSWILNDPDRVFMVDPDEWFPNREDQFQYAIKVFWEIIGKMDESQVLFLIDDSIAEEGIDKKRSPLTNLACSGRHDNCSLWILTQAYVAIPKTVRRQTKWLVTFSCLDVNDFKTIMKERSVIPEEKHDSLKKRLDNKQYSKLVLYLHHPKGYEFIE